MFAPLVAAMSPALPPSEKSLIPESTPTQFSFPNEFPYEFDSSVFFTSPEDSTETEDETSDDEDDFLAGLTRRLALSTQRLPSPSLVTVKDEVKPQVTESTLSGLGSPNGPFSQAPSPPTSPSLEDDSFKVISAAAGEVAKMKTANFEAEPKSRLNPNPNSVISVPHQNAAFCGYCVWQSRSSHYHQSQFRYRSPLQPVMFASPYPIRGGAFAAVKQPSNGTGVFLPRSYPNPSNYRKKSGGGGVRVPTKVVHKQNPKIEELSGQNQPNSQARLSKGQYKSDSVSSGRLKKERPLPQLQEWMN